MTISTEIQTITNYNSTDVDNAVTEGTSFCAMHSVTHDEIIKSAALWLLERRSEEIKARSDANVRVKPILELHDLIESLKGLDIAIVTALISSYASPYSKSLDPYNPGW